MPDSNLLLLEEAAASSTRFSMKLYLLEAQQ